MKDRNAIYKELQIDRKRQVLTACRNQMIGMLDYAIAAGDFTDAQEVIEEIFTNANREGNLYAINHTNGVFHEKEKKQKEIDAARQKFTESCPEGIELILTFYP